MHVVLMGLRASGKTTLGVLLAARLKRSFVDLDERTSAHLGEEHAGEALRLYGEKRFRDAEREALRGTLAETTPLVVALGGGTPTAPGAAGLLLDAQSSGRAWIVYLRALPEVLQRRLRACGTDRRPSLTGAGVVEEVPLVFGQRDAPYTRLADRVVDADRTNPQRLVEDVLLALGSA